MIWTEEQKTEMQQLRDMGLSNSGIGERFGTSGDIIRKVLARFQKRSAEPAMAEANKKSDHGGYSPALAEAAPVDSLRRLHDEFDTKAPGRTASRPKWAGRPPLRIMPKDFQK